MFVARGANVNATNSDGATPLHDAATRADVSIMEALLEQGAQTHHKCHKG